MRLHVIGVTLLSALLVGLTPLAHASPPDQTWLWGLYDNADYDDIVSSVTSADGTSDSTLARDLGSPTQVTARLRSAEPPLTEPALRSPCRLRAPPLA